MDSNKYFLISKNKILTTLLEASPDFVEDDYEFNSRLYYDDEDRYGYGYRSF